MYNVLEGDNLALSFYKEVNPLWQKMVAMSGLNQK